MKAFVKCGVETPAGECRNQRVLKLRLSEFPLAVMGLGVHGFRDLGV